MPADLVPVPRLLSTSAGTWLAVVAALLTVPGVVVWAFLTQPPANRVAAVVIAAVLAALFAVLVLRRTSLDTTHGLLLRRICGVWNRRVTWAEADVLRIRSNHAGQALLEVRATGDRTALHVPLVAVDVGGDRSQPAEFLRVLAAQIERWAPRHQAVIGALAAQADHLDAGGGVRESPLARAHLASPGTRSS